MEIKEDDLLRLDFENYNLTYMELSNVFNLYKKKIRMLENKYIVKQNEYIDLKDKYDILLEKTEILNKNFEDLKLLYYKKLTIKQRITGRI